MRLKIKSDYDDNFKREHSSKMDFELEIKLAHGKSFKPVI